MPWSFGHVDVMVEVVALVRHVHIIVVVIEGGGDLDVSVWQLRW